MAELYSKRPVQVQRKSGFDKSFQNLFTSKVGTLTPILVDEVIPNTTINLKAAIQASLPPLASDTFMRCKLKYASFFVPTRILLPYGSYERWLTGNDGNLFGSNITASTTNSTRIVLPQLQLHSTTSVGNGGKTAAPGTLADFLGVKFTKSTASGGTGDVWTIDVSALPFLAYHKIYNDWFRNSLVQKDIFATGAVSSAGNYNVSNSQFITPQNGSSAGYLLLDTVNTSATTSNAQSIRFMDGKLLTDLRQANFDIDMYTSCSPEAQNGEAQSVSFEVSDETYDGSFTISALRAANSIQQFLERNNIAGNRMVDYVKAQYGANLSDYIAQRPVLLGSGQFDLYSKGVYQTNNVDANDTTSQNPFNSVGSRFGSAFADGQDTLINGFTAQEPGYIFVIAWLSPRVTYSTGISPMLSRYKGLNKQTDMANPILQNVGNEPVYAHEICDTLNKVGFNTVFGYQDRYYAWKDRVDEVHGLLRDESSLDAFALQRTFTDIASPSSVNISSSFLEIPTSYMDQVAAVNGDISNYGYWCDSYFDYKVSMPLARYSTPSLQDPAAEHGETVVVNNRGTQLS